MKKLNILLPVFLLAVQMLFSQVGKVGINTNTPQATLDVVAEATLPATGKVLEIEDPSSASLLTVTQDGNLNVGKALKPNGLAGNAGDVLVSKGPDIPPVWQKTLTTYPTTIQIYAAQRNTTDPTRIAINAPLTLSFPDVNTSVTPEIGSWNATNTIFTVSKKGIFHITVGLDAIDLRNSANSPHSTGDMALWINTSVQSQTASGINYAGSGTTRNYSTNVTFSIVLTPGQTIQINGTSGNSSWQQGSSFVSILYAEIP